MKLSSIVLSIAAGLTAFSGMAADYASSSRLASGRWVKVRVTEEGIQQISYDQLRQWGFSDPERVHVYGYGATALTLDRLTEGADDLPATPTVHTADGRLLFYGDADVRFDLRNLDGLETLSGIDNTLWRHNIYDRGGYYFLSDAAGASEPVHVAAPEAADGVDVYTGHYHVDATDEDLVSPIGGGNIFCERTFTSSAPCRIPLRFRDAVLSELSDGPARRPVFAYYCYAAFGAEMAVDGIDCIDVAVDGSAAALVSTQRKEIDYYSMDTYLDLQGAIRFANSSAMPDGESTVTLSRPDAASSYNYYLDRHALIYTRLNRLPADESQLVMHYPVATAGSLISISDAADGLQLWDVTDPAAVRILDMRAADGCALASMPDSYSAASPGRMVLFDPQKQHLAPEFVQEVASQDLHALSVPDMLIITTDDLEAEAQRLADAHARIDGLDVAVCRSRDIYNEFSGGAATPAAYRRLAHMFYSRDPQRFRYVLLMGSSLRDMRGLLSPLPREVLAVHQAAIPSARLTSSASYASDSYVGWMDEKADYLDFKSALMSVAVGRFPAKSPGDAHAMVNHTIDYMENPPAAAKIARAVMTSGPADKYEHYNYSLTMINSLRRKGMVVHNIPIIGYRDFATAATPFYERLRQGCGLMGYFGHSVSGRDLANTQFYCDVVADRLSYNVYPMAVLATCSAFHIDSDDISVGVNMLSKEHGGAIGVIAATRAVYSTYNRDLAVAVADAYGAGRPGDTTGDIFRRGHNAIMSANRQSGPLFNTKCYNLCGDPAVRIPFAGASVVLESHGSGDSMDKPVRGGDILWLTGYVDDGEGNPDTTFDGTIAIEVFDTPVPGTVMYNDSGTKPEVTLCDMGLASSTAVVEGGRWTARVYVPQFSRPGTDFALSLDAVAADGRAAHAYRSGLHTSADASTGAGVDTSAPEILEMYIDSSDFTDGGVTAADMVLYARVSVPASGLNFSDVALRGSSKAVLDGAASSVGLSGYAVHSSDGSGDMLLTIPFRGLSDGHHSVCLTVSSGAGSFVERTLGFVVSSVEEATLTVDAVPARTEAAFSIDHTLAGSPDVTVIISDSAGNTVRKLHGASAVWDLADESGQPVADGVYRAHALLRTGARCAQTSSVEVVVLRDASAQ